MNSNFLLLVPILLPMIAGASIKLFKLEDRSTRQFFTSAVVIINAIILLYVLRMGDSSLELVKINNQLSILFRVDDLTRLFTVLASILWICATFYSFEYMKHEGMEVRFFTFFTMTLGVIIGVGFAGNLFTFYLFYELMTLITFPLVIHSMTKASIAAGVKYLIYSLFGAALVLLSGFFVYSYGGTLNFVPGGVLDLARVGDKTNLLLLIYVLAFIGFGSKGGMFPLHDWLPTAHPVAPAPASALLSGIITKACVLGIIRMTYFLFGADFIRGTWAQTVIIIFTLFTVFMGSMLAYKEKLFKRRLAYSSVSQVAYVLFGLALLNVDGFTGGLLHVVFHALIKNVLFLSSGAIIYMTHKTHVYDLKGIGKSMPVTMWCFTLASLALVGIPPASGFVSKWYLAMGGLGLENQILGIFGVSVLLISALLTAGYLISITTEAFFPGPDFDYKNLKNQDPNNFMKIPMIVLTIGTVVFGMFPTQLIDFIMNIAKGIL